MKPAVLALSLCVAAFADAAAPPPAVNAISLFNGETLAGWEGNTNLWRVADGAITGGSLTQTVKENDFLCTTTESTNFILRLKFKLTGKEGFVNSGVQIRSRRVPNSSEVAGYQCDLGDPDWWGAIYDEARRNKVLFPTDMTAVNTVLRRGDWNDYVIRAVGPRITVWINNIQTADYYEEDPNIADSGVIAIQAHGGGKPLIQVKEISIEHLPATAPNSRFIGASQSGRGLPHSTTLRDGVTRTNSEGFGVRQSSAALPSPLSPEQQRQAFALPPGFEIELVASEEQGVGKPITVAWDAAGRMWTMTAFEYPVDANDNKLMAEALFNERRRDKVLVFDNPHGPGPHTPRVFADGFAIPLGILPYRDGVFVQHGPDILFVREGGRRETVLTGFGIGDSHLFPHQFTRAPGGWIMFAQGAFNNSNVRTKSGETFEFNRTLMGRFTPDGKKFDTIGYGPCNIWGLVLTGEGEIFIQEANDYGYPVMPFHVGASYPGCTPFPKPYAPTFPGTARLGMGGTGLSGLALSDKHGGYPGAYANVFYIANPVMQRIQAVKLLRDGPHFSLVKLPDFIRCSDEWFRPVAIHFGPDSCLYIVDWYNKVISHNEVPRNHPDRDKTRGRIWRVRHSDQPPARVPNFTTLKDSDLLAYLGSDNLWHAHTAWQQIVDRNAVSLTARLEAIVRNIANPAPTRIQALWALEGLQRLKLSMIKELFTDPNRNIRREALRALGASAISPSEFLAAALPLMDDADPEVRAELIRSTSRFLGSDDRAVQLLLAMAHPALDLPIARNTHNGKTMKVREAYARDFERYLIRAALEKHPEVVAKFLEEAAAFPLEGRLLGALALEPKKSAALVGRYLNKLNRLPNDEELLRVAEHLDQPGAGEALTSLLQNTGTRAFTAEALLRGRTRFDAGRLKPLLENTASELLSADFTLGCRLISGFELTSGEPLLIAALKESERDPLLILRTLREVNSTNVDLFASLAKSHADAKVRGEALLTLASSPSPQAPASVFSLWPNLNTSLRHSTLDQMASSKPGAQAIISAARNNTISKSDLEPAVTEKLLALLGEHPDLSALLSDMGASVRSVLQLDGNKDSYVDSNVTLEGPFTVETWVRLDANISNDDGILGRPGGADFNFFDGRFRVYGGPEQGDRIIAKRKMTPELWTHVCVTRDDQGRFKTYVDGELDNAECQPLKNAFTDLDVGRVAPAKGTAGMLAEFRVWDRCRTAEEIRRDFDISYEGQTNVAHLVRHFSGQSWGKLRGNAKAKKTLDPPPLLTLAEARVHSEKLTKYRALAENTGDATQGKQLAAACLACHTIQG
ncbi:MAG TPA: PVC-type heme-binding CxxCH protein, partial [Verrucomicrobiae bacterium]|nr:PVC-type heme-binding CxxCH protein [Verrucomicrobiae bacterium]